MGGLETPLGPGENDSDDTPTPPTPPSAPSGPRQPWRDLGPIVAVVALALVVVCGLAVLPARTWLTQRHNLNQTRTELARNQAEVDDLRQQLATLQTDAEVERLARKDFDLVFPGEESYRIVPPGQTVPATGTGQTPSSPGNG